MTSETGDSAKADQVAAPASPEGQSSPAVVGAPVIPPEHWTQNLQESENDADSSLGDDTPESTASLTSSILRYRTIHGRTYHTETGNASYWGANDEGHNESLDIMHHLFTLCLGDKLFLAPIADPKKALDIGTGTGIWAMDFADAFPKCEVIGTDISPIQPTWVPPNLKFEIEDCTRDWTFPDNEYDYIHIRYLIGCIMDWHELFREAYRCTKPGGYFETYEASPHVYSDDDTLPEKSASAQWGPLFIEGGKAIGRSFTVVDDDVQRKAMEAAGFVDIQEKKIKCPTGGWSADPKLKEIGQYSLLAVLSDIEGFILFMTTVQGWSREQVQVYIAHLRKELRAGKYHVYYWQKVVWGRKPEN